VLPLLLIFGGPINQKKVVDIIN